MAESIQQKGSNLWSQVFRMVNSDWLLLVFQAWELIQKIRAERAIGLYEVLEFDHTLELCDVKGKRAVFRKRETVKLLQDYVASYVDQVWGRGDILADYRCKPGKPVDHYPLGHKRCILISLQGIRRRGEIMRISIDRTVRNGFTPKTGWSQTVVQHRTHRFRTSVVFPAKRPPRQVILLEDNQNRTTFLGESNTEVLPDGRYRVFWETLNPKLFETYIIKWTW